MVNLRKAQYVTTQPRPMRSFWSCGRFGVDDDDHDDDDDDDDYGDGGAMRLERSKWGCGGPSAGCYCKAHGRWGRGGRRGLCPEHQWRRTMRRCLTCSGGSTRAVAEQGNVESTVGRGGRFEAELRMTKSTGGGTQGFAGWGADLDSVAAASNRTQLTTLGGSSRASADDSDPKSSHLGGTVPHGTVKLWTHASVRNRKTVNERFRTEPQNCGLTVPYGTAKLWTHRAARNRKTVDSRFRTQRQNLWRRGVTLNRAGHSTLATPATARLRGQGVTLNLAGHSTLARTGGYPQPRRSQQACDEGGSTLARTGGYPQPRRSQHACDEGDSMLARTGCYPQPRRSQSACEDGGLPSTVPATERLRRRGVTLTRAGHSMLATKVTAHLRGQGVTLTRAGHSMLARTGVTHGTAATPGQFRTAPQPPSVYSDARHRNDAGHSTLAKTGGYPQPRRSYSTRSSFSTDAHAVKRTKIPL
ncbi:hypothetical protein DFH27DRAFT_613309 [Peziza echinospora]|nr:hypothetical protein DFH27DRAFT_613309 [Peziza echinospora]